MQCLENILIINIYFNTNSIIHLVLVDDRSKSIIEFDPKALSLFGFFLVASQIQPLLTRRKGKYCSTHLDMDEKQHITFNHGQ